MTLIIRRSSALLLMTDLYHPSTLPFTSLSWWLKGWLFTGWLKEDTKNCSLSLHFQWGLYMHTVPALGFLPKLVLLLDALSALHLPCAASLAGEAIPWRVGHILFFQNLELLYSSARAVRIFFNVRQRSWWHKFYCLTVVTEPTKGIMQNLSKHCNTILELLWSTMKVVGIFRSELWPTTESSWLALEEVGQQMLQNKAGYHGWT